MNKITSQKITLLLSKPWFLPIVIALTIILLGTVLNNYLESFELIKHWYLSKAKHQAILSVIASSLITFIAITFSITLLILTTVSNQFGPRLIPNFIQSRATQTTLGVFLGTFTFSLYSIAMDVSPQVRAVEIVYIFFLTINCLIVLIFFMTTVFNSIQVDELLFKILKNTKTLIQNNFSPNGTTKSLSTKTKPISEQLITIHSEKSGYVQAIDLDLITTIAQTQEVFISVYVRAGAYVYQGEKLIGYGQNKESLSKDIKIELLSSINIINLRILQQDLEYGFELIEEIAVRALSPGINDPYTAKSCVFLLGQLFIYIQDYNDIEDNEIYDEGGRLLVSYQPFTYQGIVDAALNRLRQAAINDLSVVLAIYDMAIKVIRLSKKDKIKRALLNQVQAITEIMKQKTLSDHDRKAFEQREKAINSLIAK